jgi:hypothetical protein
MLKALRKRKVYFKESKRLIKNGEISNSNSATVTLTG